MKTWICNSVKHSALSLVSILLSTCAHIPSQSKQVQSVKQHLANLDIYGTDRLTVADAKSILGIQFDACVENYLSENYEKFHECKTELIDKIQVQYHFDYLDLSLIGYFHLGNRPVYATFDVVETKDAKFRMDFIKRPTKSFADPDGLIQAWDDYQKIGFDLMTRGELSGARVACPAFHCIWGHQHPALQPYEKVFVEGVKKNKSTLIRIIQSDKDDHHRGIAPYLLAYETDGKELVKVLTPRLRDKSDFVRNNIMRIFSDIAMFHPDLDLPLDDVAKVLNFPATTDRNKASYLFLGIALDKERCKKNKAVLITKVVPILLKMLRLEQPNNHDPAYSTLKLLSGQDYGERNYWAWDDWLRQEVRP